MPTRTTLQARFPKANNALYQYMQDKLNLGQTDRVWRVSIDCREVRNQIGVFTVMLSSKDMPGWNFSSDLSAETLTNLDTTWDAFKKQCGESVDKWLNTDKPQAAG